MLARIINYLTPAYLLLLSAFFGAKALLLRLSLSTTTFRDVWFALFWQYSGPRFFTNDHASVSRLAPQCRGKVLDIGPGSGEMIKHLPRPPLITHIYGLEPNIRMHAQLQKTIDTERLTDVYTILPFGAEDLSALRGAGLGPGSVDTVLTVRVLCTLDEKHLEGALAGLFECLKPGVNGWFLNMSGMGGFYQIFWPWMFAGCNLNRRTKEMLSGIGKWGVNDLVGLREEEHWEVVPHVWGRLVKSKE